MTADDFAITLRADREQITVQVHGELDMETGPALRSVLREADHRPAALDIWIDFTDCPYFDGLTIALLAATAQGLRAANRQLSTEGLATPRRRPHAYAAYTAL